jgi:hypothetical protein
MLWLQWADTKRAFQGLKYGHAANDGRHIGVQCDSGKDRSKFSQSLVPSVFPARVGVAFVITRQGAARNLLPMKKCHFPIPQVYTQMG